MMLAAGHKLEMFCEGERRGSLQAKRRRFEVVLVWKLDRFGRSLADPTILDVLSTNRKQWRESGLLRLLPACPSLWHNSRAAGGWSRMHNSSAGVLLSRAFYQCAKEC